MCAICKYFDLAVENDVFILAKVSDKGCRGFFAEAQLYGIFVSLEFVAS